MRSQVVFVNRAEDVHQSYKPKSIFIGHEFFGGDTLRRADYRLPFLSALTDHGYEPLFPDEVAHPGMLLSTLCRHIFDAKASIFDVTGYNANVLIELGLALGLNRPLLLVAEDACAAALPEFLQELAPLRYASSVRLAKSIVAALEQRLHTFVDGALSPLYCTACQHECSSKVSSLVREDEYALVGVDEQQDEDLHWNIEDTIKRFELRPVEDPVEDHAPDGPSATVCRWMRTLRQTKLALFRLQAPFNERDNAAIHVQLGIAAGLGVPWTMILAEGTKPPVDLQGLLHVTAGSSPSVFRTQLSNAIKGLLLTTWDSAAHVYDPLPPPDEPDEEEQPKLVDVPQPARDDAALREAYAIPEEHWSTFTESARQVLALTQDEAQRFNHNYIATEHLLLGLTGLLSSETESSEVAGKVLSNLGVGLSTVRNALEFLIGRGDRIVLGENGVTPRAKKALELATDESRRLNHNYVGPEHLLLGLVREGEGIAAGVLESLGINLEKVRSQIIQVLAAEARSSADESTAGAGSFDKFTERARKAVSLAQEEALRFNHNYIGVEHLLLGLIREGDGVAAKALKTMGVELNKVRSALEFISGRGDRIVLGEIGLTPRSKKVIELAVDESRRLNHDYVSTEHLLLAIALEGESIASGILESLGVTTERVRQVTLDMLREAGSVQGVGSSKLAEFPNVDIRNWTEQQVAWNGAEYSNFTELAVRVMSRAQAEAQRLNHNYIGTEHLLLGLTRVPESTGALVLASLDVEFRKVRSALEYIIGRGDRIVLGEVGLTPRAKKIIGLAVDESRRLKHDYVGTEHLLLGLVREGEGIAAGVLESLGINLAKARTATVRILATRTPTASSEPPAP